MSLFQRRHSNPDDDQIETETLDHLFDLREDDQAHVYCVGCWTLHALKDLIRKGSGLFCQGCAPTFDAQGHAKGAGR